MADTLKSTAETVAQWLSSTSFRDGYVFGSLVHKAGAQFDCQVSDVDLICCFGDGDTYLSRWQETINASKSVQDLNLRLLALLGRNDASRPIASVVPTSGFERANGLHKDNALQFFSHNNFYCIRSGTTAPIGGEHQPGSASVEGALESVREAQRVRNKVLSVSPSGATSFAAYSGPDVLPKQFARCAAQVRWPRESSPQAEQRFDVNEGLVYSLQLLCARRNEHTGVENLLQRTVVRMGGRGQAEDLSVSDQVLLWELLADDARGLVVLKPNELRVTPTPRAQISTTTRAAAFVRASFRCSFPDCGVPLGEGGIGEIAQIASTVPGGARYDPDLEASAAVALDNLLVLCPTHHRIVDASPEEFSVPVMKNWNNTAQAAERQLAFSAKNLFTITKIILELLT